MTFGEKPAAVEGEHRGFNDVLSGKKTALSSFTDVVEQACEKLMDRQIKYSIRRIQEMGQFLCGLEKELDDFLLKKDRELE